MVEDTDGVLGKPKVAEKKKEEETEKEVEKKAEKETEKVDRVKERRRHKERKGKKVIAFGKHDYGTTTTTTTPPRSDLLYIAYNVSKNK